ncbi:unnamed protein product [Pleuronectes platessa]|uniref:Uncharacterized protein n=1 Tax=Pleuronectes platessa TaxID=8262 RepID=A0A9N7YQ07_PLEPL|nr:unnamed protein product [Pleuronectes platessa]
MDGFTSATSELLPALIVESSKGMRLGRVLSGLITPDSCNLQVDSREKAARFTLLRVSICRHYCAAHTAGQSLSPIKWKSGSWEGEVAAAEVAFVPDSGRRLVKEEQGGGGGGEEWESSERSQVGLMPERSVGQHHSPPVHLIAYTQPYLASS